MRKDCHAARAALPSWVLLNARDSCLSWPHPTPRCHIWNHSGLPGKHRPRVQLQCSTRSTFPRKVLGQRGLPQPDIFPSPSQPQEAMCALQTLREHNKNCLGNAGHCTFCPPFIHWHAMVKPLGLDKLRPSPFNSCDIQVVGPNSLPL